MKLILCLCLVVALCLISAQVQGQFFTKPSKSIPRMGRRSLPNQSRDAISSSLFRHLAIDALVDEYGPGLLNAMVVSKKLPESNN